MIGETVHYSLDRLINFAEKENQLPLEETFAFRYIEDLEKQLDLITNHEIKGDWCAYWEAASDERNIAGFICDRLLTVSKEHGCRFQLKKIFANFDTDQKGRVTQGACTLVCQPLLLKKFQLYQSIFHGFFLFQPIRS